MTFPSHWQTTSESGRLNLALGEVHVWRASLALDAARLASFWQTLSPDEQAKAERFHTATDRDRYIGAHGTLRALVSRYLQVPAPDLTFNLSPFGKPSLQLREGMADLRFNISHAHQLVLLAFAPDREVGVDVEYIRRPVRDDQLAERFFAPAEVAAIRSEPAASQCEAFFRCWTRKEAYVKARGRGLSIGLASFTVSISSAASTNLVLSTEADTGDGPWSLRALVPGPDYVGAVAAAGEDWSPALWQW